MDHQTRHNRASRGKGEWLQLVAPQDVRLTPPPNGAEGLDRLVDARRIKASDRRAYPAEPTFIESCKSVILPLLFGIMAVGAMAKWRNPARYPA